MTQSQNATLSRPTALPRIVIGQEDHETLSRLASVVGGNLEYAAELLLRELERARVVPDHKVGADVVRLGSFVTYVTGTAAERTVQLVLPYGADISAGRISVLTPIGAALIGLSAGQTIRFETADSRPQNLTVVRVEPEAAS